MDFTADEYVRRDVDRLREVLAGPPVTWTFIGDSITQGVTHTHGWRNYVELFAERVRGELDRRGDAVINSGVSGSTTQDLLAEFDWRAGRFAPDVLFVMFGTNDMTDDEEGVRGFRFRLDQIIQRGRDVGATMVLQTPPPVRGRKPAMALRRTGGWTTPSIPARGGITPWFAPSSRSSIWPIPPAPSTRSPTPHRSPLEPEERRGSAKPTRACAGSQRK